MGQVSKEYPVPPPAWRKSSPWILKMLGLAYLRCGGWRIEGGFPEQPKCVAIVVPHTSNWDFTLGIAVVFALELRVSWLGKHTLFKAPFKGFLRWMGGIPVDRAASHGVVGECVTAFKSVPALLLALAPEGTRKGISHWKSGFYQIAVRAGVPILPIGFDYGDHAIRFMPVFKPTGNHDADLKHLHGLFSSVHGKKERPTE